MKLTLTFILSVLLYTVNAQFCVSGGYIRRTEGRKINLPSHFGTKPSSNNNLYNFASFQVTYQTKPHVEVVGKIGFSLLNQSNYYGRHEISWGSSSVSYHTTEIFTSVVNYSVLNAGFGLNRLFYTPKRSNKKLKTTTTVGFLVQAELFLHYKESNHYSEYFKEKKNYIGSGFVTTPVDYSNSDTSFQSLDKRNLFLTIGLALNERFVFKSTYFLELKLNFSITGAQRLTTSLKDIGSDNDVITNFQMDPHLIKPILETGIGVGYMFPVKKKKTP